MTRQKLTARHLATEFGYTYSHLDSLKKIKNILKDFFIFDGRTKILEIESSQEENTEAFEKYKQQIKSGYGT